MAKFANVQLLEIMDYTDKMPCMCFSKIFNTSRAIRFKFEILVILLFSIAACGGGSSGDKTVQQSKDAAAVRAKTNILPLGDSITQANSRYNSYRRVLWQKLNASGFEVDFVGTQRSNHMGGPPDADFDLDHEGHWGWETGEVANRLPEWLRRMPVPDIVLLHIGSNDVFRERTIDSSMQYIRSIIDNLRVVNPKVSVVLAQIIPANGRQEEIKKFNQALLNLSSYSNESSQVLLVDMHSGFDSASMTFDGVHPNLNGENWLADRWLEALQGILASTQSTAG